MVTVLVSVNAKYIHAPLAPHCLKAYANSGQEKFDIRIIDTNVNVDIKKILDEILSHEPAAVGFSTYIFNRLVVLELIKCLKAYLPKAFLFCGGPEASNDKQAFLDAGADEVVVGAGEEAFLKILKKLGLAKSEGGDCVENSPYSKEYFEQAKDRIAYFEASRGCPYSCSYCMSADLPPEYFDLDFVKAKLLTFKDKAIKVIKFTDRTFNSNLAFAKQILSFLLQNFADKSIATATTTAQITPTFTTTFHFEVAPDLFDEEFFEIIGQAPKGLFQFEVGIQSFSQEVLKAIGRKQNVAKSREFLMRILKNNNCMVHADLIAGLPYETHKGVAYSFDTLYNLKPHEIQLGILKILKGSRISKEVSSKDEWKYNSQPPYEVIKTPWIDEVALNLIKNTSSVVNKIYNSGRFKNTLEHLIGHSPYEFFEKFAAHLMENHINIYLISLDKLYELLYGHLIKNHQEADVKALLKYDYSISVKNRLPKFLE